MKGLRIALLVVAVIMAGLVLQCTQRSMIGDGGLVDAILVDIGLKDARRDMRRDGIGPVADAATDGGAQSCKCDVTVQAKGVHYKGATGTKRAPGSSPLSQLNADCEAAFPNSRICAGRDILNSFPAPKPSQPALILELDTRPNPSGSGGYTSWGATYNPTEPPNCPSAGGPFTNTVGRAFVLQTDGNIKTLNCDTIDPTLLPVVACCGY